MPVLSRGCTNTVLVVSDEEHVRPSAPPPHGPAVVAPRWSDASFAYAPVATIGWPATALPKFKRYVPVPGFAASVMPPDCAAIPPSARTSAHFSEAPLPPAPAGPCGPAGPVGPAGPTGPRGSWPRLKSLASSEWSLTWTVVTLFRGSRIAA